MKNRRNSQNLFWGRTQINNVLVSGRHGERRLDVTDMFPDRKTGTEVVSTLVNKRHSQVHGEVDSVTAGGRVGL